MNIFPLGYTSVNENNIPIPCPKKSAEQQCDKHINKMYIETAQILSTAHRLLDGQFTIVADKKTGKAKKHWDLFLGRDDFEGEQILYKVAHRHHPCVIWSMETDSNYRWLWHHCYALSLEYQHRYGKMHKTDTVMWALRDSPVNISIGPLTPFKLAMKSNPECMIDGNAVESYRRFYMTKQKRFKMVWTKRNIPEWFKLETV